MGDIFWLLFRVFGYRYRGRPYLTGVSKTIESLPFPPGNRRLRGGAIHFIPVMVVALAFLLFHTVKIKYGALEIAALICAIAWSWVGASLIWNYENHTLPEFDRNCRLMIVQEAQYREIRNLIYSKIYKFKLCFLLIPVWYLAIASGLYLSGQLWSDFGLSGLSDPFVWIALFGAALYTHRTSLGFCFAYKTGWLTYMVTKYDLKENVYHHDLTLGLSFISDFALKTNQMFFSGWLFFPGILLIGLRVQDHKIPIVILGLYLAYTVLAIALPLLFIHRKIVAEKSSILNRLYPKAKSLLKGNSANFSDQEYRKFNYYRSLLVDLNATRDWPWRWDLAALVVSTLVFPTLTGVLTYILTTKVMSTIP